MQIVGIFINNGGSNGIDEQLEIATDLNKLLEKIS